MASARMARAPGSRLVMTEQSPDRDARLALFDGLLEEFR
jgi:hypothetical protein